MSASDDRRAASAALRFVSRAAGPKEPGAGDIEPRLSDQPKPPRDDAGEPALVELIRSEIAERGPITFALFMERALYEPGLGYYATSEQRPTRGGDFLTAPELHPIFGWTVARQLDEMWERLGRPREFVLREYGAGRGALAASISDGLARSGSGLAKVLQHEPVEVEGRLPRVDTTHGFTGCVLGNEFLDALPVHRLVGSANGLREIYVDWQADRFVEVAGEVSDPGLTARIAAGPPLSEGQQAEVSLRIPDWLQGVASSLERGYVLLIDYALPTAELRSAARHAGTIRAFRGQHVSSDVVGGVGHQDLTAHVDLDALDADARAAGLLPLGTVTQAEFLMGAGLEDVYARAREEADTDWQSALDLRAAMRRLLDTQHMGSYVVAAFGQDVPSEPPLSGMSFRMPGRT